MNAVAQLSPETMRQQTRELLEQAASTNDQSAKRTLTSRAFALAQDAEAAERKAGDQQIGSSK